MSSCSAGVECADASDEQAQSGARISISPVSVRTELCGLEACSLSSRRRLARRRPRRRLRCPSLWHHPTTALGACPSWQPRGNRGHEEAFQACEEIAAKFAPPDVARGYDTGLLGRAHPLHAPCAGAELTSSTNFAKRMYKRNSRAPVIHCTVCTRCRSCPCILSSASTKQPVLFV